MQIFGKKNRNKTISRYNNIIIRNSCIYVFLSYHIIKFISYNIIGITEGTKTESQGSSTDTIKSMPWDGKSDTKRDNDNQQKEGVVWRYINKPGNWLKTLETVEIWASNGKNSNTCERKALARIKSKMGEGYNGGEVRCRIRLHAIHSNFVRHLAKIAFYLNQKRLKEAQRS